MLAGGWGVGGSVLCCLCVSIVTRASVKENKKKYDEGKHDAGKKEDFVVHLEYEFAGWRRRESRRGRDGACVTQWILTQLRVFREPDAYGPKKRFL